MSWTSRDVLKRRCGSGFTLLELLLCIAIVGVLSTLLLPSLRSVRERSLAITSLSNVKTHVSAMTLYTSDNRDIYLDIVSPQADYGILRWNEFARRTVYFEQVRYWHFGMARRYYGGNISSGTFCVPGAPAGACTTQRGPGAAGYWYSAAFLAAPEYWNRRTRQGRLQWRGVRVSEVVYPSFKGVFIGAWPMFYGDLAPDWRVGSDVGFVDGHGKRVAPSAVLPPESGGDGQYFDISFPVLHTKDGARGRDVK